MDTLECFIREDSWLARLAARLLKSRQVAMVVGRTIYLHGVSASDFLQNIAWVRHEVCHVMQYRRYTLIGFLWRYLLESIRNGYYNNRFEREARDAEGDARILDSVILF